MAFMRAPKPEPVTAASTPPDPVQPAPAAGDGSRKKRLEAGGRNATFLSKTAAAQAGNRSPNTLTGLNG